jgi:hypothetical protein
MDLYVQLEHGEELRSISFNGRVRLRVDFNAIGPVVAVEPVDGAMVIEVGADELPEAVGARIGRGSCFPEANTMASERHPEEGAQMPSCSESRPVRSDYQARHQLGRQNSMNLVV